MKKKNIILIILLLLIVGILTFVIIRKLVFEKKRNNDNKKYDTIIDGSELNNWSADKVKITIKDVFYDKTGATLVIEDKNDIPTSWDDTFSIQRLSEAGVWYNIKSNETTKKLMEVITPSNNGITEIEINWEKAYGILKSGTYRIVKVKDFTTLYSAAFDIY